MPFIDTSRQEEKYKLVDEILAAPDYYHVLGIKKTASPEEIRRAYIKRSRVCHPDKFVPSYPQATQSFQTLSIAYETLINPSTKLMYDVSKQKGNYPNMSFQNHDPNDTLHKVLRQLFNEMLEGEFQTMRAFIHALNETNPGMYITEETIDQIERGVQKLRELFQSTNECLDIIRFELMKLYEIQHELRTISYFRVWKRMQLTIQMTKILVRIPIAIGESKQKQFIEDKQDNGIFLNTVQGITSLLDKLL